MRRINRAVLLLALLGLAACSGDNVPSSPKITPLPSAPLYATLNDEIAGVIADLFPNGLENAAGVRWDGVKDKLADGKVDVAQKQFANLVKWIIEKTPQMVQPPNNESKSHAAARLILDMSLYVYGGPNLPPNPVTQGQGAAGIIEPNTALTLTTVHNDGTTGDGGVQLDAGSVAQTSIVVLSEVLGPYTGDCSGPLNTTMCQQPKFFRIDLFPHTRLLKLGHAQICHVNTGITRRPLGDHQDLRVAHEKPASNLDYTPGSRIVEGIEVLPFNPNITILNAAGACNTSYASLGGGPGGFFGRLLGPSSAIGHLASAIGKAITPNSAYAIDLGGGADFLSESIFALVNPNAPNLANLALSSSTLTIGGPSVNYTVNVVNHSSANLAGIALIQGEIVQGAATRGAGGTNVLCGAGSGVLPPGTCSMGFTTTASNTAGGTGQLVAGSANFVLKLYQFIAPSTTYLFDTKIVPVTLVGGVPTISSLTLSSTNVVLDAVPVNYTAVLQNPTGVNQPGVLLQGYLVQGTTSRAAGGTDVTCPAQPIATLPTGSCTQTHIVSASNSNGGTGTLTAGPGSFVLELRQANGNGSTLLDSKTIAVTLSELPNPILAFLSVDPEPAGTYYNFEVTNRSFYPNGLFATANVPCGQNSTSSRTWIEFWNPTTNQFIYGYCGFTGSQDLASFWFFVPNGSTPPASVYIKMIDKVFSRVRPSNIVAIPSVVSVSVAPPGGAVSVASTLQLTATVVATGGAPTTVTWQTSNAAIATVSATGLVTGQAAGNATITATSTFNSSKTGSSAITVSPGGGTLYIASVGLSTTTLVIGGSGVEYTGNLFNSTGAVVGIWPSDAVVVQGWIDQGVGPTASRAAGGSITTCCSPNTGQLPVGAYAQIFTLEAGNAPNAGFGTLVPGPATARFELKYGSTGTTVVHTVTIPVTLINP